METLKLINPNLGHPLIINVNKELEANKFQIDLLFITNLTDIRVIKGNLEKNTRLVPIIEYT
jgi:hypothetical protein